MRHLDVAEKTKRTAPGVDGDDFVPYIQALKDVDYNGLLSIECGWEDVSEQLPTAVRTLRGQMAKVT